MAPTPDYVAVRHTLQVKLAADGQGVISQCMKWKNLERTPGGYYSNIALKMNTKLGE